MLNNKIRLKKKMHILLIVSFISVAVISFFFVANTAKADTSDWSLSGYNGDVNEVMFGKSKVNADEPLNKYRIGIDDIVYNRVPLFDVNVFSDTPGGQPIDTGSPLYFLRTLVANWFVLGMNLALAVMIIIIIYTGIRMALSTIAEKKAECKEMLFNFVKAIAKIFVLAAIMALIMNICQYLTSLFASKGPAVDGEISGKNLYVTMVTRALGSFSFQAKIPAAILFFGLTLTFFKFCYRYTKRLLNVYLLIIIAPVLVAKDAYEGASGKQGKTFSAWIQEFTLNVALQPAHALIYTALVFVALERGTDNILNFLLAVLIMNFMVSADKIFFKIFNMRFTKGPGAAGAADALTEGAKMYAGIQAAKEGAKLYGKTVAGTAKFVKNTGSVIGGSAKNLSNKIASLDKDDKKKNDKAVKKSDKEKQKRLEGEKPNGFLDTLDSITGKAHKAKRDRYADKARKGIQNLEDQENGIGVAGHMPKVLRNYIGDAKTDRTIKYLGYARKKNDDKNFISQMAELRRLSKRNDEAGRMTRKLLKMKKEHEIKKFKYIATAIGGVAAQGVALFAAPALVAADETDIALMGVTATMGNTSTAIAKHYYYRRNAKDELLTKRSFEDTLESLKNVNGDLGTLQAKFDAIEGHDEASRLARKEAYTQMSAYNELKIDAHTLRSMVNAYIMKQGITEFDESRLDEIIDRVLSDSGITDLGVNVESLKSSLKAEMIHSQTGQANAKFTEALNAGSEDGKGNKFTTAQIVEMAKQAVEGTDLSELTDKQIEGIVDVAISKTNVTLNNDAIEAAKKEVLSIANEQKESKFAEEMQKLINEDSTLDQLKTDLAGTAESLIKLLAIEKEEDKEKYVKLIMSQLPMAKSLNEKQQKELIDIVNKQVSEQIKIAIAENQDKKDKARIIDSQAAVSALAESSKAAVNQELDKFSDADILSKEVRDAIDSIKENVKHEKTKKGSIGTITDLDRRLRNMRDVP